MATAQKVAKARQSQELAEADALDKQNGITHDYVW
jgi:hypothetical protein